VVIAVPTVTDPALRPEDPALGHATPTRLLISSPDQPGIVAAVSRFLHERGANITSSYQHTTDPQGGTFFMRMEFDLALSTDERIELEQRFEAEVARPLDMRWRMWDSARPKRVAVLVSRYDHCLLDLLWRARRGELEADIGLVLSNHPVLRPDTESFGLPYEHVPVPKGGKAQAEERLLELLSDRFDLVVLARYMQILSEEFLNRLGIPVINIHHSFLPAFAGAGPYQRAKERGVKLIGATAHYVTPELDAGPIIEQDVIRVTHANDAQALERLGANIERDVLARAVHWHCEDRIIVHGNTTVVF
jgi:formyltetrahydrofolate deformylase